MLTILLGEAQRELERMKADKEERQAHRKKKALQKSNQQAGIETDNDDDFEPRANPTVIFLLSLSISIKT